MYSKYFIKRCTVWGIAIKYCDTTHNIVKIALCNKYNVTLSQIDSISSSTLADMMFNRWMEKHEHDKESYPLEFTSLDEFVNLAINDVLISTVIRVVFNNEIPPVYDRSIQSSPPIKIRIALWSSDNVVQSPQSYLTWLYLISSQSHIIKIKMDNHGSISNLPPSKKKRANSL